MLGINAATAALLSALLPPLTVGVGSSADEPTYGNPLDVKVADPCITRAGHTYYLYGTAARPPDANEGFPVWESRNLVDWRDRGWAWRKTHGTWGQFWFWGPDVLRRGGRFVMFYGAFRHVQGQPVGRICVAESPSPRGPFRDLRAPMFDWPQGDVIDAHAFIDGDGTPYLYFSEAHQGRNRIFVAALSEDLLSLASEPALCLEPDQPWETVPVNEGAFVARQGDTYFLFYAANDFRKADYCVAYATAPSPLGPWTKADRPLISQSDTVRGPGCAGLISSPDGRELFAYYHVHLEPNGYVRQLALDRIRFQEGPHGLVPATEAPTSSPQPWPSGAPSPTPAASDEFDGRRLDRARWLIADEDPAHWRLGDGKLTIRAQDGDMWQGRADFRNLFLQYAPQGDFGVTTRVHMACRNEFEQAFLCIWQDADNYVRLSTVYGDGPKLSAGVERAGVYHETMVGNPFSETVELRIRKRGNRYSFSARDDAGSWMPVGHAVEADLVDRKIGLGALSPASAWEVPAAFAYVRIGGAEPRSRARSAR